MRTSLCTISNLPLKEVTVVIADYWRCPGFDNEENEEQWPLAKRRKGVRSSTATAGPKRPRSPRGQPERAEGKADDRKAEGRRCAKDEVLGVTREPHAMNPTPTPSTTTMSMTLSMGGLRNLTCIALPLPMKERQSGILIGEGIDVTLSRQSFWTIMFRPQTL